MTGDIAVGIVLGLWVFSMVIYFGSCTVIVLDNLKLPNDVNSVITGTGFVNEFFNIYVAK